MALLYLMCRDCALPEGGLELLMITKMMAMKMKMKMKMEVKMTATTTTAIPADCV